MDPKHKTRRQFSNQFKTQTVTSVRNSERSIPQVCMDLDLAESVVRQWVAQAEIDAGLRDGLTAAERAEWERKLAGCVARCGCCAKSAIS